MKPPSVPSLKSLAPIIEEICEYGGVAGVSLGVAYRGEIVHTANFGFRDVEERARPDADTLYSVGLITKTFTASAVGNLVAEKKLNWSTPIKTIIPELDSRSSVITEELTIIELLTHQLGLERSNNWWFGSDGVELLKKDQTVSSFNALRPISPFRSQFQYSNWGFTLAREVVERVSGMSYGEYLSKSIFTPLGMDRTTTESEYLIKYNNAAKPYAAMDDTSLVLLPAPDIGDNKFILGAQGITTSINDILKYATSLWRDASRDNGVVKHAAKQLAGHIFRTNSFYEQSYGLSMFQVTLPGTIGGGSNGAYATLPTIEPSPDNEVRTILFHGGSMAGYSCYLTMIPELEVSFAVFTNSIGLADPSGWLNELVLSALVDSPTEVDFAKLAKEAAQAHVESYQRQGKMIQERRAKGQKPTLSLQNYVGSYVSNEHSFVVQIRQKDSNTLQIALQGLDSQLWDLDHVDADTFTWFKPRNEHAARGRFTYAPASVYTIIFKLNQAGIVDALLWPHDPSVPHDEQNFIRDDVEGHFQNEKLVM